MKILVISHNSFATHQSMGKTFLSLFSNFQKEELCQLYIYPTIPDVDVCNSYFRVTDKDVLHSIFKFKALGGEIDKSKIASQKPELFENAEDINIYRKKNNKDPLKRLLRDLIWKFGHWYGNNLKAWLQKEKPTCIFLSPGYAKFIYDIALKISKELNIPIVTYICDDYYFVKEPEGITAKLQLSLLRKKTDKLLNKTSHLVTISNEIKDYYFNKFKVPASVIMTGSNLESDLKTRVKENRTTISYFGNVSCNRYTSLIAIGQELDRINDELSENFSLNIFTAENDINILDSLKACKSINLMPFVSGEEFIKAFFNAEVLLHTEAFDENSIDLVKHSVSTKIADSLFSGIPLLAFGPDSVSSMKHLIRNDCAVIATNPDELRNAVFKVLNDKDECMRVAEKAVNTAMIYHDRTKNSKTLKNILTYI